ncbi:MAG: hypothetical protein ACKOEM_04505, partial [Planctomycetia bacterium]
MIRRGKEHLATNVAKCHNAGNDPGARARDAFMSGMPRRQRAFDLRSLHGLLLGLAVLVVPG